MTGLPDAFGGSWTEVKLDKVRRYLAAYVNVMKNQPFATMYIDAFAGTGFMSPIKVRSGLFAEEEETVPSGSARLALNVSPSFSQYVFIEKNAKRHKILKALAAEKPGLNIEFRQADANDEICEICRLTDWRRKRAVVFLDPFGMQVEWRTIEALGKTQSVDLWYLVPTGIAIARLMPRRKAPPQGWQERLDLTFGDQGWRSLYDRHIVHDLFDGTVEGVTRSGGFAEIENYVMERLRTVFYAVSPHVAQLSNSRNRIYSLVFCCGNPRGAPVAMKIANHILTKK